MTHLDAVLAALASDLPELAEETCARIYAELDSYAGVDRAALESSVARNLSIAMTALRDGRAPVAASLGEAVQTAQERFDVGVPVEEIIRAFRVSIALIHERFVDAAVQAGLSAEVTVAGSRILWAVGDAFTTRVVTTYHGLEVTAAWADASRRGAVVRAVLAGRWPDEAALYGLDAGVEYAAVRAQDASEGVRAQLERSGGTDAARALVVVDGDACVGVVTRRPDADAPVGLGPFVAAADLPRSDRVAREALALAQRLGRGGVQGVKELGWRLAAASRPDVGSLYAQRFLDPLASEGAFGEEVRSAVAAWLGNGRSVARTASALRVHENTVRYRLARFVELTGADLADPDDLIGVAWALEMGTPGT